VPQKLLCIDTAGRRLYASCVAPEQGHSMRQEVGHQTGQIASAQLLQLCIARLISSSGKAAGSIAMRSG